MRRLKQRKMMIVSNHDNNENNNEKNNKKLFTIQYTKEELDKIQSDFLQQIRKYFAKVNNNSSRMNEVELFPPTIIEKEQEKQKR